MANRHVAHLTIRQRLDLKSIPEALTGCTLHWGLPNAGGYVRIGIERKTYLVHRLAWIEEHGPIPDGLDVLHRCDTRACINPIHLFLGTQGDNNADRDAKGRHVALRGESNGSAKLTDADAMAVFLSSGTYQEIGDAFGISNVQVGNIKRKDQWKHIHN